MTRVINDQQVNQVKDIFRKFLDDNGIARGELLNRFNQLRLIKDDDSIEDKFARFVNIQKAIEDAIKLDGSEKGLTREEINARLAECNQIFEQLNFHRRFDVARFNIGLNNLVEGREESAAAERKEREQPPQPREEKAKAEARRRAEPPRQGRDSARDSGLEQFIDLQFRILMRSRAINDDLRILRVYLGGVINKSELSKSLYDIDPAFMPDAESKKRAVLGIDKIYTYFIPMILKEIVNDEVDKNLLADLVIDLIKANPEVLQTRSGVSTLGFSIGAINQDDKFREFFAIIRNKDPDVLQTIVNEIASNIYMSVEEKDKATRIVTGGLSKEDLVREKLGGRFTQTFENFVKTNFFGFENDVKEKFYDFILSDKFDLLNNAQKSSIINTRSSIFQFMELTCTNPSTLSNVLGDNWFVICTNAFKVIPSRYLDELITYTRISRVEPDGVQKSNLARMFARILNVDESRVYSNRIFNVELLEREFLTRDREGFAAREARRERRDPTPER